MMITTGRVVTRREKEARVRAVLAYAESDLTAPQIADRLGLTVSQCKKVLYGHQLADVLPELPRRVHRSKGMRPAATDPRTYDMVRRVLTAPAGMSQERLAAEFGVSRETIRKVRTGQSHARILPELPRQDRRLRRRSCRDCRFWRDTGPCPPGGLDWEDGSLWQPSHCDLGFSSSGTSGAWHCGTYWGVDE